MTSASHATPSATGPPLCIVGGGAVGRTLAVLMSEHAETSILVKSSQRRELIDKPLTVSGARSRAIPPRTVGLLLADELSALPPNTEFWVCVKAFDLDVALRTLAPHLQPSNSVVILTNGLGIFMQAAETVRRLAPLVRVLTSFGVQTRTPTEVVLAGDLVATVAAPETAVTARDSVARRLRLCGALTTVESNVSLAEWRKAVVNLIVNPLCSLAGSTNGALATEPALTALITPLLTEIATVASKEGFDLSDITADIFLERLAPHMGNTNSMLVDLRARRRTELDYMTGRFLAIAASYDVPAPLNRAIFELLKHSERQLHGGTARNP